MNIGFDLDKIFINLPFFVPPKLIDFLYKGKQNHELKYRIPSKLEQLIRVLSHHPFLRSPITSNIEFIKKLNVKNNYKYFLISSRFDFLKKRTDEFIRKNNLARIFDTMFFNYKNQQPHKFKNEILSKLNLDMYVDDDLQLLGYLKDKNPKTKFFWLNDKVQGKLKGNLFAINSISEMFIPLSGVK